MKWTQELNKFARHCNFTVAKGAGHVRREQYRFFLVEYPHLDAKVTKQRIADQKSTILVRHLLSEVEIGTIRMLVKHPPSRAIELFKKDR